MFPKLSFVLMSIAVIILCVQGKMDTKISNDSKLDVDGNGFDSVRLKVLGEVGKKIYYRSVGDKLPWLSNFQLCKSYGLEMGSIESEAEQLGIDRLLKGISSVRLWTSGFRYSQNVFVWWSSGAEFKYTNWANGEPNNLKDENCIELHLNEFGLIVWNDQRCDYRLETLCEVDTNPGKKNKTN